MIVKALPNLGEEVRIKGQPRSVYRVVGIRHEPDGVVVCVWGGDKNILAHQSYRYFTLDRVMRPKSATRKTRKGRK